jgi:hypothetical protein
VTAEGTGIHAKVFCIGFHKTGTSSMGKLLLALGYETQGSYKTRDRDFVARLTRGDLEGAFCVAARAQAFHDNPWPILYRQLDARFPGSRFILTLRDPASWIRSAVNHFGSQADPDSPMRELIYGAATPVGHEPIYVERFRRHNDEVREYFAGRERDLLAIDLNDGDALQPICDFLGQQKPRRMCSMPHEGRRLR